MYGPLHTSKLSLTAVKTRADYMSAVPVKNVLGTESQGSLALWQNFADDYITE